VSGHRRAGRRSAAFLIGSRLPLQQVVFDPAGDPPGVSLFTLVFADAPPPEAVEDGDAPVCAHCLIAEYGAAVAVPLDLAVAHGCTVVRDQGTGEWRPDPGYFGGADG
jgi:hypothetical protein